MSSATFLWFSNPSLTCSYRGDRKSLSDNFYFRRPQRKNNGPEFLKTLQSVPCPAKMMLNYTTPWLPTITAEKIDFYFWQCGGEDRRLSSDVYNRSDHEQRVHCDDLFLIWITLSWELIEQFLHCFWVKARKLYAINLALFSPYSSFVLRDNVCTAYTIPNFHQV